jgi:hypothetical protein
MSSTLTIRLTEQERGRLKKKAKDEKTTESDVIRELIAGMDNGPRFDWERVKHLVGSIKIDYQKNPIARELRKRSWRP